MKQGYTLVASYTTEDNSKGIIKEEIDTEHGIAGTIESFMNKINNMDKGVTISELSITVLNPDIQMITKKAEQKSKGFLGFNVGGLK